MSEEADDAAPTARVIARRLRDRIEAGGLGPGDRLPSIADIREEYGVARATALGALQLLGHAGVAESRAGSGFYVRRPTTVRVKWDPAAYRAAMDAGRPGWSEACRASGHEPQQTILAAGEVVAPREVAEVLGVAPGSHVTHRLRLFKADGVPVQVVESLYPLDVGRAARLSRPGPIRGSAHLAMVEVTGPVTSFETRVVTRMPTEEEVTLLQLLPGTPVLDATRVSRVSNDQWAAVEVMREVMAGDRVEITWDTNLQLN